MDVGSHLIERLGWLQPLAGGLLVVIGLRLVAGYMRG
jgi:hypothetical protein